MLIISLTIFIYFLWGSSFPTGLWNHVNQIIDEQDNTHSILRPYIFINTK